MNFSSLGNTSISMVLEFEHHNTVCVSTQRCECERKSVRKSERKKMSVKESSTKTFVTKVQFNSKIVKCLLGSQCLVANSQEWKIRWDTQQQLILKVLL